VLEAFEELLLLNIKCIHCLPMHILFVHLHIFFSFTRKFKNHLYLKLKSFKDATLFDPVRMVGPKGPLHAHANSWN